MSIYLVAGGARSGKSRKGEELAKSLAGSTRPIFIATAEAVDEEMTSRIKKHQDDRGTAFDLVEEPELVLIPEIAVLTSVWYWNHRKINEACDVDDIAKMTKLVQGGKLGLEERKNYYEKFKALLSDLTGKDMIEI